MAQALRPVYEMQGSRVLFLFFVLAAIGLPRFATAEEILLVGDSHLQGAFGATLESELVRAQHKVRRVSGCGISAVHLVHPVPVPCAAAPSPSSNATFVDRGEAMPDLAQAARGANLVVVNLGTNQYLSRNLDSYVGTIAAKAKSGGARCQWVGPPDLGTEELRERMRAIDAELSRITAKHGCAYVSSLKLTRYPERQGLDGVHYPNPEASRWAEAVAAELGGRKSASVLRLDAAMYLRGQGGRSSLGVVPKGTELRLDSSFLRAHFGGAPDAEDVQALIRNPEAYGLRAERIYVPSTRRYESHYLYPVEFTNARGTPMKGFVALHFADLLRKIQYAPSVSPKRVDPPSLAAPSLAPDSAQECAREIAESGLHAGTSSDIRDLLAHIEEEQQETRNLWAEYEDFARRFYRNHGHKAHKGMDPEWEARNLRAQYLKDLIEEFGQEKASLMLAAVTAWGEAGRREKKNEQLADLAAVLKVIENRASTKFSSNRGAESLLASLGIPKSEQNERLKAILARLQFSVWNLPNLPKKDQVNPSLVQILGFNPDSGHGPSVEKMRLAFEAQEKMGSGKIRFRGAFGNPDVRHYLADYFEARTAWASQNPDKKIADPIVRVTNDDGSAEDVNVNDFRTPKHLFYGGLR